MIHYIPCKTKLYTNKYIVVVAVAVAVVVVVVVAVVVVGGGGGGDVVVVVGVVVVVVVDSVQINYPKQRIFNFTCNVRIRSDFYYILL